MSGYAGIAQRMSTAPELGTLRSFSTLSFQRLLYLQAELTHLEKGWRETESQVDKRPDPADRYRSHSWEDLAKDVDDWKRFQDLERKLKEYSKWYF
jgi:hypothetical protein